MSDNLEDVCHEELAHTDGPVTRKLKEQAKRIKQLEAALEKAAKRFDEIGQNDDAADAYAALEGKRDER